MTFFDDNFIILLKFFKFLNMKPSMKHVTKHGTGDKYVPQPVLDVLRSSFFGGAKESKDPKDRRSQPTFLLPAEPP